MHTQKKEDKSSKTKIAHQFNFVAALFQLKINQKISCFGSADEHVKLDSHWLSLLSRLQFAKADCDVLVPEFHVQLVPNAAPRLRLCMDPEQTDRKGRTGRTNSPGSGFSLVLLHKDLGLNP